MRGFCGVAIYHPKFSTNTGSLWRTADILGVEFFATIGRKYKQQPSDTMASYKHIPMFQHESFEGFFNSMPKDCKLIGVELTDNAIELNKFEHPERAIYLLGAEDFGIPPCILNQCHAIIKLPGTRSMNVAVAGSIVTYDRFSRGKT